MSHLPSLFYDPYCNILVFFIVINLYSILGIKRFVYDSAQKKCNFQIIVFSYNYLILFRFTAWQKKKTLLPLEKIFAPTYD